MTTTLAGSIRPTDPKPTIVCPCGYTGPCVGPVIDWHPDTGIGRQGRCPECGSHRTITTQEDHRNAG